MGQRKRIGIGAVIAFVGAIALPFIASAHALLLSSTPAANSNVQKSPAAVVLTFGEEPDVAGSHITVLDTSGGHHEGGRVLAVVGNPLQLAVPVLPLQQGVYTVSWRTLSVADSHTASGSFAFGVGVTPTTTTSPPTITQNGPSFATSLLAIASRGLYFTGLILGVGVALIVVLGAPLHRRLQLLLATGFLLTGVGMVGITQAELIDAQLGWDQLFSVSLGFTFLARLVIWDIAGICLLGTQVRSRIVRRIAFLACGVCSATSMFIDVRASHAATQGTPWISVMTQWLHIATVGVWIGGLCAVLAVVGSMTPESRAVLVRRFSTCAGVCLGIIALTGILRTVTELTSWSQLITTTFGVLIVVKVALLVLLAVAGALNRFRNIPHAATTLRGLRRVGSTEVVVGMAAVVVAAALVNVAPPISAATTEVAPTSLIAMGNDYGTSVRAQLEVSPGHAGFNHFTLTATDYNSGVALTGATTELRFSRTDSSGIGESTLKLKAVSGGIFTADGGNLSLSGTWSITALIQRGAHSVDIPLQLTVPSAQSTIDVGKIPGEPTVYTIHVEQGRVVQVYLDPDKAGPLVFHATFFDNAGNELPVTTAVVSFSVSGGTSTPVPIRELEPGHFVANITLAERTHFDISGVTDTGDAVATSIDITPGA